MKLVFNETADRVFHHVLQTQVQFTDLSGMVGYTHFCVSSQACPYELSFILSIKQGRSEKGPESPV